jgi:hypothetical protein
MSTEALTTQTPKEIQQWTSPTHIKERITAIQKLMKTVLKAGTKENDWAGDYGILPGTKKPSLWKSGSEQILAMFQIAVEPIVEDLSTEDCYRYRVTTRLTNSRTGEFLGAGLGECSTDETKYKWRRTYSKAEFEATDPDRRRIRFYQYKDKGQWVDGQEMQVRQEAADLSNTCLKMAKKRSQIDATLTVTGASSMFEQDLEDLPEETQREFAAQRSQGKGRAQESVGDVMCSDCGKINGHAADCKHNQANTVAQEKCGSCNAPAGKPHATTCSNREKTATKPAEQPSAAPAAAAQPQTAPAPAQITQPAEQGPDGLETMRLVVQSLEVKERAIKKAGKLTGEKQPYRVLAVISEGDLQWSLYAWDTKHFEFLDPIPAKTVCIFQVKKSQTARGDYYSLEHILDTGGLKFQDDKPVINGEVVDDDEDWALLDEQAAR